MADRQENLEAADLPIDLQLDLLVDEELPEDRRRALLKSLDKTPGRWRDLSIRFLERQVEKKTIHQLITGKSPEAKCQDAAPQNFPIRHWLTPMRFTGIAAGLAIAAGSAIVALHLLRPQQLPVQVVANNPEIITTPLPGSIWNSDRDQPVKVNVTASSVTPNFFSSGDQTAAGTTPALFTNNASNQPALRRTVVIKPDGTNNALFIPVTNLQYQ